MLRLLISHNVIVIAVELLLSYGASVNDRDCNGSTPLHLGEC